MIYECRPALVKRQHVHISLLAILALYLGSHFGIISFEYWAGFSIGIIFVLAISFVIANSKVRVEIEGGLVSVYHSGMVQGNFSIASIKHIETSGKHNPSRIVISTNDDRRIYIPGSCFSAADIEQMRKELGSA